MRIQLPHTKILETHDDLSKNTLNDVMRRAQKSSLAHPEYLEMYDGAQQRFLFFRDGQIYASGLLDRARFSDSTIRDFICAPGAMSFPKLVRYQLNNKILHSILIVFQKKAALSVQTSLVDLDEVLDRIESENKSCIVSAMRDGFLALLRYEKGTAALLGHEESVAQPREATFRDEFLVKIYTITTEAPVTIDVYEDLLVSYASDARAIPDAFDGSYEDLYFSKPPIVSLRFKDKEIDHWVLDRPRLTIGRTADNTIVIDNLAVSRLHAVLEIDKGEFYVRDCDSLNGTVVNGRKVGRSRLGDGDVISIGKHTIVFQHQGGHQLPAGESIEGFDQTMIIERDAAPPASPAPITEELEDRPRQPRIVLKTQFGDRVIEIKDTVTIGNDVGADIPVEGMFIAKQHAEIVREGDRILLRHLKGLRKVTVAGKSVRETELKNNDEIKIAKEAFIFQE